MFGFFNHLPIARVALKDFESLFIHISGDALCINILAVLVNQLCKLAVFVNPVAAVLVREVERTVYSVRLRLCQERSCSDRRT